MKDFSLSSDSAIYFKTTSGQTAFVVSRKNVDAVGAMAKLARTLEGIDEIPGEGASWSEHGIAEFAIGISAIERINEDLQ